MAGSLFGTGRLGKPNRITVLGSVGTSVAGRPNAKFTLNQLGENLETQDIDVMRIPHNPAHLTVLKNGVVQMRGTAEDARDYLFTAGSFGTVADVTFEADHEPADDDKVTFMS